MTVLDFINQDNNNGKELKSPHGILGQCVSVSSLWAVDNGWPELFGAGDDTAYHIWLNGVGGYEKVPNTPSGVPVAGDIFFFGQSYGGGDGHTGVVVSATTSSVTLFEQNDPLGSPAHLKTYTYNGALGWFHHAGNTAPARHDVAIKSPVNVRTAPHVTAPIFTHELPGTVIHCVGLVPGDMGTVGTHTSNEWWQTEGGHFFNSAAAM